MIKTISILFAVLLLNATGCTKNIPKNTQEAVNEVKGESLFVEASSKMESQKNSSELLNKVFSKYPQAAYKFEVGKPQLISADQLTNKARIKVSLKIKLDKVFIDEMTESLSRIAEVELSTVDIYSLLYKDHISVNDNKLHICLSRLTMLKNGASDKCFSVDKSAISSICKTANKGVCKSLISHDAGDYSLKILFKDKNGDVVEMRNRVLGYDDSYIKELNFNGLNIDQYFKSSDDITDRVIHANFTNVEPFQPPITMDSYSILLFVKDGFMPM